MLLRCCDSYSMCLLYDIEQCLTVQRELNVIILFPDPIILILPEVLVLCTKEHHWDIQQLVVQWV